MNEDYFKKISTRFHCLEVNVTKLYEIIRRNKLAGLEKEEIHFRNLNEELLSDKSFGKEIILIDVEDEDNGYANSVVGTKCSGIKHIGQQASDSLSPICLMERKHNWVYYVLLLVMYIYFLDVSYFYIMNEYDNWQSSPVVQATSNNQVHFANISFPAVTICWPDNFNQDYDFFKNIDKCFDCKNKMCTLKNETCDHTELTILAFAHLMCLKYGHANPSPPEMWRNIPRAIDGEEFGMYMKKLLPSCETHSVALKDGIDNFQKYSRCDGDTFQQFYFSRSNRLCMTYNSLRHEDIFENHVVTTLPQSGRSNSSVSKNGMWSFDNMMEFNGSLDTVPVYGLEQFIILLYKRKRNYEQICSVVAENIASIMIHSPNEIPYSTDSAREFLVRDNIGVEILLEPKITLARDDLTEYPPHQRGCYFTNEKKLAMFKFYTKNNCEFECLVDAYVESCGCVPFEYPRQNYSIQICLVFCPRPKYECECLPDCNFLSYEITTQEAAISGLVLANVTVSGLVELKFKGKTYYNNLRYSISSRVEFIGFSFGMLGTFIGFSVPCFFQLFFSGLMRLWSFVRTSWKKKISPSHRN